ncbi:MAG: hypothetical protein ABW328_01710 [Ilumatobacteraceae bacterium]
MNAADDSGPDVADVADVGDVAGGADAGDAADDVDGADAVVAAPGRPGPAGAGDILVSADVAGTLLFAVTAALAAALFTTFWQWVAAITAMALFGVGVFAFLWSYYNAVQRSRRDEIGVAQLYLLLGPPTPARVRRAMLGLLCAQFVIAAVTTFARLDGPDGKPGSSLALGFLVPMLGFGLNGLWAAYHGDFPTRRDVVAE